MCDAKQRNRSEWCADLHSLGHCVFGKRKQCCEGKIRTVSCVDFDILATIYSNYWFYLGIQIKCMFKNHIVGRFFEIGGFFIVTLLGG